MSGMKFRIFMLFMIICMVSFITAGCGTTADEKDMLSDIQDRQKIEKLMWDYARALDTGNADAFVALFTEDGQFGRGESAVKGKKALEEMMGAFRRTPSSDQEKAVQMPAMYHMTANHYIEFIDKDHAVFNGYWLAFTAAGTGRDMQPNLVGVGREVNEVVRVGDKWMIQVRDIMPQN